MMETSCGAFLLGARFQSNVCEKTGLNKCRLRKSNNPGDTNL
jgi:hypothetical protein